MTQLSEMAVREFVAATAAKRPTPGGGSVAAVCGALAAALAAMAVEYTVGKKAFAAHETELREALGRFQMAAHMLVRLMEEDAAAYEQLAALLKLPEEQRVAHADYAATVAAAIRAPQAVGGFAASVLEQAARLVDKTNRFLVSDLGIAAAYACATVQASELSVRINLPLLRDAAEAEGMRQEMRALVEKADRVYTGMRRDVMGKV